jgi:ABC-2 type transport system ATP-binding protein
MGYRDEPKVTAAASNSPGTPVALKVDAVSHRYGEKTALNDVSLIVRPSSFTVLLGLNGAGKSTLFSLITRLYAIRAGRVCIFGHDVMNEPGAALRQLGVVFQSRALDLDISVRQNLLYHAALHGIGRHGAEKQIASVLERVAMNDQQNQRVGKLSIGQMRRIEIARALLHQPKLLLLDEPTVGLDINARADILGHVRQLLKTGVGVLWATHLIDEVTTDDDLVVLHEGRVLGAGPVSVILRQAGCSNIRNAFAHLTRSSERNEG